AAADAAEAGEVSSRTFESPAWPPSVGDSECSRSNARRKAAAEQAEEAAEAAEAAEAEPQAEERGP
ncbi:hypothetical protein, partial [Leifsonia sp. C5G2]|uniref:hypothetical protein n=1 Tax=Leifsonia sp. C5G2 TaxID=2735269 RepID=UPI001C3061F3